MLDDLAESRRGEWEGRTYAELNDLFDAPAEVAVRVF